MGGVQTQVMPDNRYTPWSLTDLLGWFLSLLKLSHDQDDRG